MEQSLYSASTLVSSPSLDLHKAGNRKGNQTKVKETQERNKERTKER